MMFLATKLLTELSSLSFRVMGTLLYLAMRQDRIGIRM